jgi:hypothetical protein
MKGLKRSIVSIATMTSVLTSIGTATALALETQGAPRSLTTTPVQTIAQATNNTNNNNFAGVGRKRTSGTYTIVTEDDGTQYLELNADFRTDRGPDLFLLLHHQANPQNYNSTNYLNLGKLEKFQGTQRYEIPADVDLTTYESVVVWCQQFNVTFGFAGL